VKILFGLLLLSSFAFCEHIKWQNDYEKALMEAKKEKREILLLILKKECAKCKTIFTDIFNSKEIEEKINEKYISAVVFFEDKNSYPIELFYTQQFPALFFVSKEDESFLEEPLFGEFTKEELKKSLLYRKYLDTK